MSSDALEFGHAVRQAKAKIGAAKRELYHEGYVEVLQTLRSSWNSRLATHKKRHSQFRQKDDPETESWDVVVGSAEWKSIKKREDQMQTLLSTIEAQIQAAQNLHRTDPLNSKLSKLDREVLSSWVELKPFNAQQEKRHMQLLRQSVIYRRILGAQYKNMLFDPSGAELLDEQQKRQRRAKLFIKSLDVQKPKLSAKPKPQARLIRSPRDAELVALDWMLYWGFDDARATPVGPDAGIDVASSRAVAQVKAHMVPIGRPELQNLVGVAAVEGKLALFFALTGYTAQAIEWGTKAKMALFTFDLQGVPNPANDIARKFKI